MPLAREHIRRQLRKKGFVEEGGRDHIILRFEHGGLARAVWTKLSRGKAHRVYGDHLLGKVSHQLMVTRVQLNDLVACPLELDDYVAVLRGQGLIVDASANKPSPPAKDLPAKKK